MSPRGFGKTYFSLSSILAHNVQDSIGAEHVICSILLSQNQRESVQDEEDDPPPELLEEHIQTKKRRLCHCNCFFKAKARLVLLENQQKTLIDYFVQNFTFRSSGIHPPPSYLLTSI